MSIRRQDASGLENACAFDVMCVEGGNGAAPRVDVSLLLDEIGKARSDVCRSWSKQNGKVSMKSWLKTGAEAGIESSGAKKMVFCILGDVFIIKFHVVLTRWAATSRVRMSRWRRIFSRSSGIASLWSIMKKKR